MNASQLFFNERHNGRSSNVSGLSQKYGSSVVIDIPDAPSHFEEPFISSQRAFSDIKSSQLFHSSPSSSFKEPFPPSFVSIHEGKRSQNPETQAKLKSRLTPPASRNPSSITKPPQLNKNCVQDLDILSSQFYRNTQSEQIQNVPQKGAANDHLESYDNVDLSELIPFPHHNSTDSSGYLNQRPTFSPLDTRKDLTNRPGGVKRKRTNTNDQLQASVVEKPKETSKTPWKTPHVSTNARRSLHLEKDNIPTPVPLVIPTRNGIKLRPLEEIPEKYRCIFGFPYFNIVQSRVFDEVSYTDKPLVVCAPTGAGKTVIFELAIIRLMMRMENYQRQNFKVVYMAPIKALCSEKYSDWKDKFAVYNLKCCELTGDTEIDDYYELQEVNIILTTPEKWDSMTRRWRDNTAFVQSVCLFCIDEIHVLNDTSRGATIEAVVSRMKTIQAAMGRSNVENCLPKLRFVAVSATIPNIEDVAEWLGEKEPAISIKMDDSVRPVRLRKVVLGFYFNEEKGTAFHFDMSLNYKLAGIINTYSEDKPTLVFCSTRKSTQQAGEILAKDSRGSYVKNTQQRQKLMKYANMVKDNKLRDLVMRGIGFHHAGMDVQDRKYMEELFSSGDLPVLVATSTLAMGVNLPAHLVILKSTQYYNMGCHEEYSDTQILQMIGRAGRPQFDTTATAVIMTKNQTKAKYEDLLNGTQVIESSLHKNLVEHLNAEIVLHTINDMSIAMEWIRYTFIYIRVMKNPKHYGMPTGLNREQIEKRLQDLCMRNLNELESTKMITMNDETFDVKPTEAGRLMARYCVAFETMKKFCKIAGKESVSDLVSLVADCEEFAEIQLRTNEKRTLNTLNKDKNRATIRFPIQGKVKTKQMKVNVLIQAALGSLTVQDFSLQQDTTRIFRAANRVARCLLELLWSKADFRSLLSAVLLCKSFKARLWEDSKYVTKQLDGIGPTLSNALVNAGITTFQKIEETNPRELELIVNRHPPFGNQVRDAVAGLPKYELTIEQVAKYNSGSAELWLQLNISNKEQLVERRTASPNRTCVLLIGDEDNKIVYHRKIMDTYLIKDSGLSKKLEVKRADNGPDLFVNLISQDWVGMDVQSVYTPFYSGPKRISSHSYNQTPTPLPENDSGYQPSDSISRTMPSTGAGTPGRVPCNHHCMNKRICGHECCRNGVIPRVSKPPAKELRMTSGSFDNYMSDLKSKLSHFPDTPRKNRIKASSDFKDLDLNQFAYSRRPSMPNPQTQTPQPTSSRTPGKHQYLTPQGNYGGMSDVKENPKQRLFNDDCQMMEDEWNDLDFGEDLIGDNEDEICPGVLPLGKDGSYSTQSPYGRFGINTRGGETCIRQNVNAENVWQNNNVKHLRPDKTVLNYGPTKVSDKQYEGVDNYENGNKIRSSMKVLEDNCNINMDWSDLDMYQKKREEYVEENEDEFPGLDTDEENYSNHPEAYFQIQSSLLPAGKSPSNQLRNFYSGDTMPQGSSYSREIPTDKSCVAAGPYNVNSEQLTDDLPHLYSKPSRKPPLTPHRYGQVVAWNKTENSPHSDWSGSDNDLIAMDTDSNSTSALFNRSKEILNKHTENIKSKPWQKKQNQAFQKAHPTKQQKLDTSVEEPAEMKNGFTGLTTNREHTNTGFPGEQTVNKSHCCMRNQNMYNLSNTIHAEDHKQVDNWEDTDVTSLTVLPISEQKNGKGEGLNSCNTAVPPKIQTSISNFFVKSKQNPVQENQQDVFNSIFDGIF